MKQTDLAMLILIISFSLVASYFIGNAVFVNEDARSTSVPVAEPISTTFPAPDAEIFNNESINLTEQITIGDSNSETPFTNGNR